MEDSEKLTALKKAYADIILNAAKEAAARIMVSERKAIRFQRELVATKEEALRMLVRLKRMMDAKAVEAETKSLKQNKKIEELEAQLEEAEDIVKDLRGDLRVAEAELEKVKNYQIHSQCQQLVCNEAATQEETQQNRLTSYITKYSVPGSHFVGTSDDTKYPMVNGAPVGSRCDVAHNHRNSCFVDSPDFASIMVRRKEPELFRNGCTHRIRASERSLLESELSVSGQRDDLKSEWFITKEDSKEISAAPCLKGDDLHEIERNSDEQELMLKDSAYFQQLAIKAFHWKIERVTRYEKHKSFPFKPQHERVNGMQNASPLLYVKNSLDVIDDEAGRSTSTLNKDEALKGLSPSTADCDSSEIARQSRLMDDAEGSIGTCFASSTSNSDKELLDKSDLSRQDSLSGDNWYFEGCRAGNKPSTNLKQKESDLEDKIPSQSETSMFLKYTRKRKKQSLSCPDRDYSLKKCNSTNHAKEEQNFHVEPKKSCNNTELSHGTKRPAQAGQFASKSEKK